MRNVNSLPLLNLAASLLEGDGTYTWNGEPFRPAEGYQVGGLDTFVDPPSVEALAAWLARSPASRGSTQVGSWRDPETGTLYIDVCDHWSDLREALFYARHSGEKAIWNWREGVAINV